MIPFQRFISLIEQNVTGYEVVSCESCFGNLIQETACGSILINRSPSQVKTLEEARQQIKQQRFQNTLKEDLEKQSYEQISENKIAEIIRKHNDNIKITDTLIEKYVGLASSKSFTADSAVHEIRNLSEYSNPVTNKIHYILEDGSNVYLDPRSQDMINNIFGDHPEVIDYMRQDATKFVHVVSMLEE